MKTKFHVNVETEHPLSSEQQIEMLAYIRNAMSGFSLIYPDANLTVIKEVSDDEIMGAIKGDSQTIENCFYFDDAQGRHKCTNDLVKSTKCRGVCKHYWSKNRI